MGAIYYNDELLACAGNANNIAYDPTGSGLSATNTQVAIDEVSGMMPVWSSIGPCITGDTTLTISDTRITTSSAIELFKETGTANVNILSKTITTGQIVYTFDPLTEATSFRIRISNGFTSGGGFPNITTITALSPSAIGDTSVTITDPAIHASSVIDDIYWSKATGTPLYYYPTFTLAEGSLTFSFPPLTEVVTWIVNIRN